MEKITQWMSLPLQGDKMSWVKWTLDQNGMESKVRIGIKGPVLMIPSHEMETVAHLLAQQIGELYIGDVKEITYADLPDDHPVFSQLVGAVQEPPKGPQRTANDVDMGNGLIVQMHDIESTNVSAVGFVSPGNGSVTAYLRFKGGQTYYRYPGQTKELCASIWNTMQKKWAGDREVSVGSEVHHALVAKADAGEIACEKLDLTTLTWVRVPTKAERKAATQEKYK
jgi:hypothetical protein